MKHEITNKFIDLVEGRLGSEESKELLAIIKANPELSKKFQAYQELINLENNINQKNFELNSNFSVKVMESIHNEYQHTFIRRLIMQFTKSQKIIFSGVATTAMLLLTLKIYQENPEVITKQASFSTSNNHKQDDLNRVAKNETKAFDEQKKSMETESRMLSPEVPRAKLSQELDLGSNKPKEANKIAPLDGANAPQEELEIKLEGTKQALASISANKDDLKGLRKERSDLANAPVPSQAIAEVSGGLLAGAYDQLAQTSSSERYTKYTENPIIAVHQEAISTFSIDVDTGSYTNTRRFLRMGQMPPTDSIRAEEFINYFKYDYPAQYEKPFSLNYEFAPSPLEKEKFLLKLGIKAKDARIEEKPWHLVFLIDVSGSMQADDKLGLVKQSLTLLTNKMRPTDKVSIVTYAGSAGTLLAGTSINEKDQILKAIEGLSSGGSTYGSAGIEEAYQLASKYYIPNGVNRVILATDGDFNVGTTSTEELVNLISEKRKSNITLTTIGFGTGNYNEGMMEQLANKGNGNYFYIDSFGEARKVFEQDLFGTIEVVAKDVKLQIEFNPEHVSHYRLIGYDNRLLQKEDFNNDQVDAGEIGSSHTVTALYEVVLTGTALAEKLNLEYRYQPKSKEALIAKKDLSEELAFLKVRFKAPTGDKSELLTFPIVKSEKEPSTDFNFIAATSYFAALLRHSQFLGDYTYVDVLKLAEKNLGADKEGYRREMLELIKNADSLKK